LNADGSFTYRPAAGYVGGDSFAYAVSDGLSTSSPATVTLTVTDQAPVAANDAYSVNRNSTLNVPAAGVLANDTDADGDALKAVLVSGPSHGPLTLNADGSFIYKPAHNFRGTDSFTYRASDGALTSGVATVTITVGGRQALSAASAGTAPQQSLIAAP